MDDRRFLLVRTTNCEGVIPPIGLLYVASAVRDKYPSGEIKLKVVDFHYESLDARGFANLLHREQPDFIGFSSLNNEYPLFKELCSLARKECPDAAILAGGPLVSNYHTQIVQKGLVDVAVRGEGESAIGAILEALKARKDLSDVPGITFLRGKDLVSTPALPPPEDLDTISFPAWDLIDLKGYSKRPNWNGGLRAKPYAPILTSRGCVYDCVYCHKFFGRRFRARSPENVLAEMSMLYHDYRVREFHIIDDLFNLNAKRVREICQGIVESKMKVKLSFPSGLRIDIIDAETLRWLRRAGAYKINFAIETASPRLQKYIKKRLDLGKATAAIEEAAGLGIITFGFFMLGFPTETADEMRQTIDYAVNSRLDTAKFFKVSAYPNTELAEMTSHTPFLDVESGHSSNEAFYDDDANFSDIPTDVLNDLLLEAHWKFYTRPGRIVRILVKYRNVDALRRLFDIYSYVLKRRQENTVSPVA